MHRRTLRLHADAMHETGLPPAEPDDEEGLQMTKMKRAIAVLLCAVLLLTAAPLSGLAGLDWPEWQLPKLSSLFVTKAHAETYGDLSYLEEDGKIRIVYCDPAASGDLVIPAEIDGLPVTAIDQSAFKNCNKLTGVTIPGSVTSIGYDAFYGCNGLTSITIPDSVTRIGGSAFRGCIGLKSAGPIGGGYDYEFGWTQIIPANAFYGCSKLIEITLPATVTEIGDDSFAGCSSLPRIELPEGVTKIDADAFSGCSSLTDITIPDTVTTIGNFAFYGCSALTDIHIPDGITSLYGTFHDCSGLTSVTIPDSVTIIDNGAFYGCTGLTSIMIPASVTSIGSSAFYGCTGLTNITIPDTVTRIGDRVFYNCSGLTSIAIPDSVTYIGERAFDYCNGLTKVQISNLSAWCGIRFYGITSNPLYYAHHLFLNGTEITDLTIPDSVTSIGSYAFYDCTGLTSVTIPDSVTSIGESAFFGCAGLTNVKLPAGLKTIEQSAFHRCSNLSDITIPESVTEIGQNAFADCIGLTEMDLSENAKLYVKNSAFSGCSGLQKLVVSAGCSFQQFPPFDGCSGLKTAGPIGGGYDYEFGWVSSIPIAAFAGTGITSVVLPDGLQSIGQDAFSGTNLTEITLPDSLKNLGGGAFRGCAALTSIVIPDGIQGIRELTFENCTGLTDISLPASVREIDNNAFNNTGYFNDDANWDENVLYSGKNLIAARNPIAPIYIVRPDTVCIAAGAFRSTGLKTVQLPEGITTIDSETFKNCSQLTSVEIPDGVRRIDSGVFFGCKNLCRLVIPESVNSISGIFSSFGNTSRPDDLTIYGFSGSYAQQYANREGIDFVELDRDADEPYLTLHCLGATDAAAVEFFGAANPGTVVEVYDGDTLIGIAETNDLGRWRVTLALNAPVDPSEHHITAIVTLDHRSASKCTVLTFQSQALYPTDFILKHHETRINLLDVRQVNLTTITALPLTFKVKLSRSPLESVSITSTKGTEVKRIPAVFDDILETWTAEGWFDANDKSYAPGVIGLEVNGKPLDLETANVHFLIDPSGYAYEAVKSNRVADAIATIYCKNGETETAWDANRFEQENPQTTDDYGMYHWDVTEGSWQIRIEKAGYEPAASDWMDVPPEWTEVAIPLVTTEAPAVKSVEKDGETYIVTFSQYMKIESLNAETVTLKNRFGQAALTITPLNQEPSGTDGSVYYASVFRIAPQSALTDKIELSIKNVKNYAGIALESDYSYTEGEDVFKATVIADGETIAEIPFTYGQKSIQLPDVPKKEGHTGAWPTYTLPAHDITIEAVYTPIEYTVTYYADDQVIGSGAIPYGNSIWRPRTPQKEGYTFTGWMPKVPETMPANDLTFYAVFEPNAYTVTWIVDGAAFKTDAVLFGEAITAPTPEKEGYTFTGWDAEIPATMPAQDLTFHAVWEKLPDPPTIKIKNFTANKSVDYKATVTFTAIMTDAPAGTTIHWFIDGRDVGTGEAYTKDKATASYTVQCKLMQGDVVLAESEIETVKVNTGFFAKLIAFFRSLFNRLPVITQAIKEAL